MPNTAGTTQKQYAKLLIFDLLCKQSAKTFDTQYADLVCVSPAAAPELPPAPPESPPAPPDLDGVLSGGECNSDFEDT